MSEELITEKVNQKGEGKMITDNKLKAAGWDYPMEEYEKGSNLLMLAMDTKNLWENGGAVIPTLAWMAEEEGGIFDSYWAYYRDHMRFRQFFDNHVAEQLYLVNTYFKTKWFFLGEEARTMLYPIPEIADSQCFSDYISLYRYYLKKKPLNIDTAVILPHRHQFDQEGHKVGDKCYWGDSCEFYCSDDRDPCKVSYPLKEGTKVSSHPFLRGFGKLQFYLWPDIYFNKAIGFTDDVKPEILKEFGIKKVKVLHTDSEKWSKTGFQVEVIDTTSKEDNEWDITLRTFKRWRKEVKGIAHGIWQADKTDPGWLGFMIRNRYLPLYHSDWRVSIREIAKIAAEIGNRHIPGCGDNSDVSYKKIPDSERDRRADCNWNHVFMQQLPFYGLGWWILPTQSGVPSVKRGMRFKSSKPQVTPWDIEYSDEKLEEFARQGKIGITQAWAITDMAFLPLLPNMLDIYQSYRVKFGICLHLLPWVEYYPEWYQKMFTPAYAPYAEPIFYDTGLSWFYGFMETKGILENYAKYLSDKSVVKSAQGSYGLPVSSLKAQIDFAMQKISKLLGKEYLPRGYFPGMGLPEFQLEHTKALNELGFEYAIKARGKDYGEQEGKILEKKENKENLIILNSTDIGKINPGRANETLAYSAIEKDMKGPGCILRVGMDSGHGFFISALNAPRHHLPTTVASFSPDMVHRKAADMLPKEKTVYYGYNLAVRAGVINYIAKGGESGRLFSCKPHELMRYAKIIERIKDKTR